MTIEYENAWAKYQSTMNIVPLPLICWDFFRPHTSGGLLFKNLQKSWVKKVNFLDVINEQKREIVVTDKDFKIIFATDTIVNMNGYNSDEIIGKSPSFFQGIDTCNKTKQSIKKALEDCKPFKEVILNYKKNGETYWCEIEAYPKFDNQGNFVNYIAFERLAS